MTQRIQAHEATIKTAAVEVKSLTISGKQVTLSVFRQLKNEPLFDPKTGELCGVPWGTVNYFWGDCKPDHLHVVWQKDRELRRACVYQAGDAEKAELSLASIYAGFWRVAAFLAEQERQPYKFDVVTCLNESINCVYLGNLDQATISYISEDTRTLLVRELVRGAGSSEPAVIYESLVHCVERYQDRREQYARHYRELEALDQLFIAV